MLRSNLITAAPDVWSGCGRGLSFERARRGRWRRSDGQELLPAGWRLAGHL